MLLQEQGERGRAQRVTGEGLQSPVVDHHRIAVGDHQQAGRALVLEASLAGPVEVELALAGLPMRIGLHEAALGLGQSVEIGGGPLDQGLVVRGQRRGEAGAGGRGYGDQGRGQEITSAHAWAFSGWP